MQSAPKIKVRIAHSDPLIAAGLAATLNERRDFEVASWGPASTDRYGTESHFLSADVVVADYDSGLRLTASQSSCKNRVMILTHNDSEARICHALERGARGYLLLGCRLNDLLEGLRLVHAGNIVLGPIVATRIAERMRQEELTRREGEILGQMMLGRSNKKIASELVVSLGTVKTHVKSILRKLNAASRTEAMAIAQRRGILAGLRESPHSSPAGSGLVNQTRVFPAREAADSARGPI